MARSRWRLLIAACAIISFGIQTAHSFIAREYTLQEVIDACTNIAFGKVESVDREKQRAIVKLEEDLKGKSEFSHIKINLAVGQRKKETSPEMLMEKFNVGLPVIIFYQVVGSNLNCLGYVSGTWFQVFGADNPDKNRVWWNFTHIEIYMDRTFSGSTEEFQRVVRATLSGKKWAAAGRNDVKVLMLSGNGSSPVQGDDMASAKSTAEFLALKKCNKVGEWNVVYEQTKDRNFSELQDVNILWIGVDELGRNGYHLDKKAEQRIKSFVRRGGVVIVTSQDSDAGKLCGTGWTPEAMTGVEEDARSDFEPTKYAGDIFKSPNQIKSGTIQMDDTWTGWSGKYKILATTNSGKSMALATLEYGKGMYVVTALNSETENLAKDNAPLMENIMHFSVKWLKAQSRSGRDVS